MVGQEAQVRQLNGAIQSSEAQVASARLNLNYARIVAPIDGRLGLRQVDAGNLVRSGDQNGLVVITQMRPISVIFTVPETELPPVLEAMRADRQLSVEAWDRADAVKLATGTLQTVDNQIDTTTGTIKLRATFENADESLFPNQFVNIRLRVRTLQNATTIPAAAVQRASFGDVRLRRQARPEPTVSIQRVTLGPTEGERVSVTNGLAPQAQVVLEGVDQLTEGAKVEIVPKAARQRVRRPADAAVQVVRAPVRAAAAPAARARRVAVRLRAPLRARARRPRAHRPRAHRVRAAGGRRAHEHLAPVHPAARRDGAADGGAAAVGHPGLPAAAGLGAAAGRLPDDPHHHLLSGRQPGGDDQRGHGAARAAVRSDAGPGPDVVDQLGRRLGDHAALRARQAASSVAEQEVQAAINAANSLLPNDLPQPPVYNKVNPADTPVLTLAVTSATVPLPQIYDLVDTRVAQKLSQLPGVGLVSIAGGQRPAVRIQANPQALAVARPEPAEHARGHRRRQRQPAEGQLRRPASARSCSTPTISCARPRPTGT